jgi:hypothetical protein
MWLGIFRITLGTFSQNAIAQSATACNNAGDQTASCFATVPDILNGKTKLLETDDLVMNSGASNLFGLDFLGTGPIALKAFADIIPSNNGGSYSDLLGTVTYS